MCVCVCVMSSVRAAKRSLACRLPDLDFVKAQREVEDLCKLLGQGLLSLQGLRGGGGGARQTLQQALQGLLWRHTHTQHVGLTCVTSTGTLGGFGSTLLSSFLVASLNL